MKKVLREILSILLTLLVVSFLVFALSSFAKGDASYYLAGENAGSDEVARLRSTLGLDRPFLCRYVLFLRDFFLLSWPVSIQGFDIRTLVVERGLVTLELSFAALLMAVPFSIFVCLVSARRRNGLCDVLSSAYSVLVFSLPSFLISLGLMFVFSYRLRLFPISGFVRVSDGLFYNIGSLFLPSLTLAMMHSALYIRVLKKSLFREMGEPYVLVAVSRGEGNAALEQALRPASVPFISLVFQSVASLIAGSAVVETVFALPGIGSLLVNASLSRDVDLVTTLVMLISLLIAVFSIISEIAAALIDPRILIRKGGRDE